MFDLGTKVLVVDDIPAMRKIVRKACRELGFTRILEAADGAIAWQMITTVNTPPIGIIISDWNMPNCTGIELLKKIRGDQRFARMPFILVTAEANKLHITEAMNAGVSNYIVKPFAPATLKKQLTAAYKKYHSKLD